MSQDNVLNRQLVLKNDFYVKQNFIGNSPNFIITNGMLYQKFQGYILQQKENSSEESAFFWEPEDLGIDIEKIDDKYPIESKSWLMYFGIRENHQTNKFIQEAFILPQFNQPKILILNPNEIWDYRNEYFFLSRSEVLSLHEISFRCELCYIWNIFAKWASCANIKFEYKWIKRPYKLQNNNVSFWSIHILCRRYR